MNLLAGVAEELVTLLASDCGLVLLAQLTLDIIIRINGGTGTGSRHRTGSEVVGGEIFNSPLWNLLRLQRNAGVAKIQKEEKKSQLFPPFFLSFPSHSEIQL